MSARGSDDGRQVERMVERRGLSELKTVVVERISKEKSTNHDLKQVAFIFPPA